MSRPCLSVADHALKGSRPTRAKDPTALAGRPRCPRHLSAEARRAWRSAVRILSERGTLTEGDATTLELYSELYSRWVEAKRELAAQGLITTRRRLDSHGTPFERDVINPLFSIVTESERRLSALAEKLGLSPASREKVKLAKKNPQLEPPRPGSAAAWLADQEKKEAAGE